MKSDRRPMQCAPAGLVSVVPDVPGLGLVAGPRPPVRGGLAGADVERGRGGRHREVGDQHQLALH